MSETRRSQVWAMLAAFAVASTVAILFATSDRVTGQPLTCVLNTDCGCSNEDASCNAPPEPGFCNGGTCECNTPFTGDTCAVRVDGASCVSGTQCASTFCVTGVCCNSVCDGPDQVCTSGTCTTATRAPTLSLAGQVLAVCALLGLGVWGLFRRDRRRRSE